MLTFGVVAWPLVASLDFYVKEGDMSTSSPIIGIMQAGQTVEEMAVIGQRAVRDIASKFQLALQTFNNLDKAADTTSAEQEQERIANFQEQITTLHGTVATIRSAYQSCLRSPNSDGNCESSDHLVSEKERLLQVRHLLIATEKRVLHLF